MILKPILDSINCIKLCLFIILYIDRKKLSNFSQSQDWIKDCNNYVAKSYMAEDTPKETYFEDVKLQMDAKLWGEEYNRHNPPKKVDIFQMAVLEMVERKGMYIQLKCATKLHFYFYCQDLHYFMWNTTSMGNTSNTIPILDMLIIVLQDKLPMPLAISHLKDLDTN